VVFGQIVDRRLEWNHFEATLNEHNQICVKDLSVSPDLDDNGRGGGEELDFGNRVIEMSMGYDTLIVATTKTCYVYSIKNFNITTPHIFDLQGIVNLIIQTESFFLIADNVKGMQVYNYEGRPVCSPKVASLQAQFLKAGNVTISNDCLAIIDRANPNQILLLDTMSGKQLADPIKHDLEIVEISLNQTVGLTSDRKLFFIDRNTDMYI
jgi:intraflagellar transport protein 80